MNQTSQNPYQSPSANLVEPSALGSIDEFRRFTAWGVFGLQIITLGIYPIYWLYTRARVVNSLHHNKIAEAWIIGLIVMSLLYFFATLTLEVTELALSDFTLSMIDLTIGIIDLLVYLVVLFAIRNRLLDIVNNDSETTYQLNALFTLLFGPIYLQYKINEAIDNKLVSQQP